MRAPVQQANGFVLAVNLDQGRADLAQGRDPGRLVVDIGAAAAVGAQYPSQDQILARLNLKAAISDQGQQIRIVGCGEDGGGDRLFRAMPDQAGIAPPAQRQAQRVQNDRLAGPGLAGQHGQAALDVEIERIHQDDIAN